MSHRQQGHPNLLSLAKDMKLSFYTEPRAVAWQSITQPLRHASSTIYMSRYQIRTGSETAHCVY